MAEQHTQGTKVWLEDPKEGWIQGDVLKVEKDLLHVRTEQGSVKQLKPEQCPLQNPGGRGGVEVCLHSPSSLEIANASHLHKTCMR